MANGGYRDDPTISNEAELLRRIPRWHIVSDDNTNERRPSSAAFDNDKDGPMSVTLADELKRGGRSLESALAGHTGFALASITAGLVRECQQGIVRDPTPDEPAHALVFGKKTGSVRKKLSRSARWVIPPPAA